MPATGVVKAEIGDVFQIHPDHDKIFGGCFMLVTEPKSWGAQGYFEIPGKGRAYYRCEYENMDYIGKAAWIPKDEKGSK